MWNKRVPGFHEELQYDAVITQSSIFTKSSQWTPGKICYVLKVLFVFCRSLTVVIYVISWNKESRFNGTRLYFIYLWREIRKNEKNISMFPKANKNTMVLYVTW